MLRWRIFRGRDAPGAASGTPVLLFRGNYYFVGATVSSALFGRAVHEQKENRAGWPGSFCVELDAVTSQRGATGTEGMHLCASGRSQIERSGAASGNRLWAGCKRLAMHPFVSVEPATDCFYYSYAAIKSGSLVGSFQSLGVKFCIGCTLQCAQRLVRSRRTRPWFCKQKCSKLRLHNDGMKAAPSPI